MLLVAGIAVALEPLTADRRGTIVVVFRKAVGGPFGAFLAEIALNAWIQRAVTYNDPRRVR